MSQINPSTLPAAADVVRDIDATTQKPEVVSTVELVPLTLRQVDPLIRQLTLYRDLIDQKTGGSE